MRRAGVSPPMSLTRAVAAASAAAAGPFWAAIPFWAAGSRPAG